MELDYKHLQCCWYANVGVLVSGLWWQKFIYYLQNIEMLNLIDSSWQWFLEVLLTDTEIHLLEITCLNAVYFNIWENNMFETDLKMSHLLPGVCNLWTSEVHGSGTLPNIWRCKLTNNANPFSVLFIFCHLHYNKQYRLVAKREWHFVSFYYLRFIEEMKFYCSRDALYSSRELS